MLFNDQILFVHVPKTAGMAVTEFLLRNLPGPLTLTEPSDDIPPPADLPAAARAKLRIRALMKRWRLWYPRHVTLMDGPRHVRLAGARDALTALGRRLEDFKAILAAVRNPYDMEVSRYHFLRLGYQGIPGLARGRAQIQAMQLDFEQFALHARFDGRPTARIEQWYELEGRIPDNLRILKYESLEGDLARVLGEYYSLKVKLARSNASRHAPYRTYLTPAAEEAIWRKYRWLFDRGYYERETG